jgi:hypothetical protein
VGRSRGLVLNAMIFAGSSVRRGVGAVRLHPDRQPGRGLDRRVPGAAGVGGAIMFPAALGIVVQTFGLRERGRALACSSASRAG